jgi:hypothetical protein
MIRTYSIEEGTGISVAAQVIATVSKMPSNAFHIQEPWKNQTFTPLNGAETLQQKKVETVQPFNLETAKIQLYSSLWSCDKKGD